MECGRNIRNAISQHDVTEYHQMSPKGQIVQKISCRMEMIVMCITNVISMTSSLTTRYNNYY